MNDRQRLTWGNGVFLAAGLAFALLPLYWLVMTSFKPWLEYGNAPLGWWPGHPTLENYHFVFIPFENAFGRAEASSWGSILASFGVAALATAISVTAGFMAALAIVRYRLGRWWLPLYILSFRMVPPMAVAIPIAVVATMVGFPDGNITLVLVYAAYTVPVATWVLRSYLEQVPPALEEAAQLDGLSRWAAHWRVTLPLMKSGLIVTAVFVFILNWGEAALAVSIGSGRFVTIPAQLMGLTASPNVQVALSVLAALPLVLISYFILPHLGRSFSFGFVRS